jgi:hypothetical protein
MRNVANKQSLIRKKKLDIEKKAKKDKERISKVECKLAVMFIIGGAIKCV